MKKLFLAPLALALLAGCDSSDPTSVTIGADNVTATEETAATHNVLGNDTSSGGGALTIASVSDPANGTATISGSSILYTPDAGFVGSDSYTYVARDADGATATGSVTVTVQPLLVGTWRAEGLDVSPGLYNNTAFPTRRVDATFRADNTYSVVATNDAGVSVTFAGTWQLTGDVNARVRALRLNQSTPSALVSTGIYAVAAGGATMQYEVIQTEPAIAGFTAPTVAAGFGSTAFNGTPLGIVWIQNYTRVTAAP